MEDHPGQQVDEGGVGGEQGGDDGAIQRLQGLDVEIVGGDWHQAEHNTTGQQTLWNNIQVQLKYLGLKYLFMETLWKIRN